MHGSFTKPERPRVRRRLCYVVRTKRQDGSWSPWSRICSAAYRYAFGRTGMPRYPAGALLDSFATEHGEGRVIYAWRHIDEWDERLKTLYHSFFAEHAAATAAIDSLARAA